MVPGPEKRDHELGIQFGANHENPNHTDTELTMFQPNSSVVYRGAVAQSAARRLG